MNHPASMAYRDFTTHYVLIQAAVIAFLALLAYQVQHSALDMAVSSYFYDPGAGVFPLRRALLPDVVGRYAARLVPISGAAICVACLAWSLREARLRPARAALLLMFMAFCFGPLLAGLLKQYTAMPRPMALAMFGGHAQWPDTFWALAGQAGGKALPSVHSVYGYIVLCVHFAGWALGSRRMQWVGLAAGLLLGATFGALRVMQGMHFLSQTLWSLAFVWAFCSVLFYPLVALRRPAGQGAGASAGLGEI